MLSGSPGSRQVSHAVREVQFQQDPDKRVPRNGFARSPPPTRRIQTRSWETPGRCGLGVLREERRGPVEGEYLIRKAFPECERARLRRQPLQQQVCSLSPDRSLPIEELSPQRHASEAGRARRRGGKVGNWKDATVCYQVVEPRPSDHPRRFPLVAPHGLEKLAQLVSSLRLPLCGQRRN